MPHRDVSHVEELHVAELHRELLREIFDELAMVLSKPQNLCLYCLIVGYPNLAGLALVGGFRLRF